MFANKVVVITGSSAGIGAATAEHFAKEGASVVIVGRNEIRLKNVSQRCKNHGASVLSIKADITKDVEAKTVIKQTIEKYSKLDVLVNNAGIVRYSNILDSNMLEVYDEVMDINLRAVVLITHLAIPYVKETKGNIINVSSISSTKAFAGFCSSIVCKAALDNFTKSIALELAPFGVRVNSINPGIVKTHIIESGNLPPEVLEDTFSKATFAERLTEAEEVADLMIYLASDKAKSITGSICVIDSGRLLK